ncbi:MAG: L-rhamnose isomerase [Candidatus Bathyarchaeota archaeon]|nr:L-rhamnose isomerase [Candidatus Bathyarchaeota archaeon]
MNVEKAYELAEEAYAELGVDVEQAMRKLAEKTISLQCWQGDDVAGFERSSAALTGGIMATGNYPGKARNLTELHSDLEEAMNLIPGPHRVNLHATYGEFKGRVDRNGIEPEHFDGWVTWAKEHKLGLDFNATLFSHPKSDTGFTLSSKDPETRRFWVEHVKHSRRVSAYLGKSLSTPCIHNLWIPDGMKDTCVDRIGYRRLLAGSLDEIFMEKYPEKYLKDAVESKLFGLGSECYVVGSHDFYLAYALKHGLLVCIDMGHYHPTESIGDKVSSILLQMPELMIHVSRGVRWDSDHVPVFDDQLRDVAAEVVRCSALDRVYLALDYFDASINRVAAWVVGARATQKALLCALLEPWKMLLEAEEAGDYTGRLALLEELKTFPLGAVWNKFCKDQGVLSDRELMSEIREYEKSVQFKRR